MKRLPAVLIGVLLACGAQAANSLSCASAGAGWLYWTIDLADSWGNDGWIPTRPTAEGTFDAWLVAKSDAETWYFRDSANPEEITLDGTGHAGDIGGISVADLSVLSGDLSAYAFYAQIGTYDGYAADWTSRERGYASLGNFIQSSEISPGDVWNAAVVPEPTSAMLMLFALAGLALRRKPRA